MSGFNGPGYSPEPTTELEAIVGAMMDSAREAVELADGKLRFLYISIVTDGLEPLDACTAVSGEDLSDDPQEAAASTVAWLLSEAKQTAERLGMRVAVMPIQGAPNQQ